MILSFELTMPNVGSWNGKWTGENRPYFRSKTLPKKEAETLMDGKEKQNFYYNFGDGWGANVCVKVITSNERRKLDRLTKGFCGYEWMIDSIIEHGKIITD